MHTTRRPPVGLALRAAHHAFRQAVQESLPAGLSLSLAGVLLRLDEEDGLSAAELARREVLTAQTMNQLVGRLLDLGHVERRPHHTHGRILTIHLTRRGRRALEQATATASEVEDRLLKGFTLSERRALLAALRRIQRAAAPSTSAAQ